MVGLSTQHHGHKRFPEKQAFLLDNPIRRFVSPPERLISKIKIGSNDVVVDFGCGPGFFSIPLAKIARRTIGVDISPRMLEKSSGTCQERNSMVTPSFLACPAAFSSIRGEISTPIVLRAILASGIEKNPGPQPKSTTTSFEPILIFEINRSGGETNLLIGLSSRKACFSGNRL